MSEKAPFISLLTKRERHFAPAGSRMADDFEIQIDEQGHKKLVKVGEHDIYEEIQSYLEETKIENILARASAGDLDALNQRQGTYADIADFPQTLGEAQKAILKLGTEFEKLPNEIREKFDFSKEKFIQEFGSPEWANKMGFTEKAPKTEEQSFVPETKNEVLTPEV